MGKIKDVIIGAVLTIASVYTLNAGVNAKLYIDLSERIKRCELTKSCSELGSVLAEAKGQERPKIVFDNLSDAVDDEIGVLESLREKAKGRAYNPRLSQLSCVRIVFVEMIEEQSKESISPF